MLLPGSVVARIIGAHRRHRRRRQTFPFLSRSRVFAHAWKPRVLTDAQRRGVKVHRSFARRRVLPLRCEPRLELSRLRRKMPPCESICSEPRRRYVTGREAVVNVVRTELPAPRTSFVTGQRPRCLGRIIASTTGTGFQETMECRYRSFRIYFSPPHPSSPPWKSS